MDQGGPEPDPLYDAPLLIFVYAAWTMGGWLVGGWFGLGVLVGATAILTGVALRAQVADQAPSFKAELASMLLFCAASLGVTVLVVRALSRWPALTIVSASFSVALALVLALVAEGWGGRHSGHDDRRSGLSGTGGR